MKNESNIGTDVQVSFGEIQSMSLYEFFEPHS